MKVLALYPYPVEPDGLSLQGHYLSKGLKENGIEVISCDRNDNNKKNELYKKFKPNAVIGIGFWGNVPELVEHPLNHGMIAVPWFNANGWVANYHETLNKLPLLIATSNWVRSTYMRDGVNGDNIKICSIGYDPDIFYPKKYEETLAVRRKLGVKDDEVMILTAGGDVTSKGAQEMIQALAKADKIFPKWKYVLKVWPSFSADNHGKEEKKLIDELKLDEKKFIYIKDTFTPKIMAKLINACDIYAGPSRLEGFGMIQLEAQACGKPVISINIGGPKDTIVHNVTGFLVDVAHEIKLDKEWVYPNMGFAKKMIIEFPIPKTFAYRADIDQLAECTLKLMQSQKLRDKMGNAGAQHALDNFHYNVIAKKMIQLIEENVLNR
ncbi:MAG: glycosyltransferase family 4 protein [Nanoarchaeota archaeon]|nr:glycosyltransferase family 4 protein [Nanoarchaeota archaeon]